MARTFADPFTGTQTSIDGALAPKNASGDWWDGATYVDLRGVKWDLTPVTDSTALLHTKPDRWTAKVSTGKSPYEFTPGAATDLALLLENIDDAVMAVKMKEQKGSGFPWWLILVGAWALSKKNRRRR